MNGNDVETRCDEATPGEAAAYRRNLLFLALVEAGWGLGTAFVSPGAVLPMLAASMGASMAVVGLLPGLSSIAMSLPQLVAAHRTAGMRRQLGFVARWHVWPTFGFLAVAGVVAAGGHGPGAVALLYGALALWYLGIGYVIPVWVAFVGKLSGPSRRAHVFGVLSTMGLLLGSCGAWLAGRLLVALPAPWNYAAGAVVAFAALNLANLAWLGVDEEAAPAAEEPSEEETRPEGLVAYVRHQLRTVAGDVAFVQFLLAQQFLLCHQVLGSFYLLWAKGRFGASAGDVMDWSGLTMVSQAVASVLYSWAGDRVGARTTLLGSQLLLAAAMGWTLMARQASDLTVVSVLLGLFYGTYFNAKTAMVLEMAEGRDTAAYLAVSNLFTTPAAVLLPAAAGWAMDRWGFPPVLIVALGGTALGSLFFVGSLCTADLPRSLFAGLVGRLRTALAYAGGGVRRARVALGLW